MKVSIIIEARSLSKRYPYKILKNCYNKKTFLEYLVTRLKKLSFVSNIIIATTTNKVDKKIVDISKKLKVKNFKGSEKNVLSRVLLAAKKYNAEIIIRVTSDCPLIDLDIIYQCYQLYVNNNFDYVSSGFKKTFPLGMDVEVFSYKTLKNSVKLIKDDKDREYITTAIRRNPKEFRHCKLIAPKSLNYPNLSLTLDYKEDAKLLKKIIKHFGFKNYSCLDVINFLKANKSLIKINSKLKRTKYNY